MPKIDLHRLAKLHGPERAFLSLYLSSNEAMAMLDERIDRVRNVLDGEEERQHLEENAALVRQFLEGYDFHSASLCVFVCWALNFFEAYPLEYEVEDLLRLEAMPFLRPLAEFQDENETCAVVAADNTATRVYLVTSARPSEETRVRGDIKNHVRKGGQSQKRYERRRENSLLHYAKDVADVLEGLERRTPFEHLVVLGSAETMREIREALSPPLLEKLVATEPAALGQEDEMWETAFGLLEEEERDEERGLWEEVKNEYLADGRAAMGPGEVLEASALGRVQRMIVTRSACLGGTSCRNCENLSVGERDACLVCGSEDVFSTDLVNALVGLVEEHGGTVEFADPIPGLSRNGEVAALLRY